MRTILLVVVAGLFFSSAANAIGINGTWRGCAMSDRLCDNLHQQEEIARTNYNNTPVRRVQQWQMVQHMRGQIEYRFPGVLGHIESAARAFGNALKFEVAPNTLVEGEGEFTGSFSGKGLHNIMIQSRSYPGWGRNRR